MATKVTILGQEPIQEEKKKIEFVKYLDCRSIEIKNVIDAQKPCMWERIILLKKKYGGNYDLMYAYDESDGNSHCLFLGHFNDGVV